MNNNFVVTIPKELKHIKARLFFGLTKRQLIGFTLAILVGFSVFMLLKDLTNTNIAMYALFFSAAPIFFLTIYTKDGLPAEQWLKLILEYNYMNPNRRRFKTNKFNEKLALERGISFEKGTGKTQTTKTQSMASTTTISRFQKSKNQ